ncbi:MAG: flavin reductase family protein [Alphaproteobacteria bacterium]|nr:flavin reductase family protein [Alphaproteobacteria bacterium]
MIYKTADIRDQDGYKLLVSLVVPRPIAWVTTVDDEGIVNCGPYSFFNAVSGDPPVVVIGIGAKTKSTIKDTGINIRANGQFVVNLVSEDLAEQMNLTAIDFEHGVDELKLAGLSTAPSAVVKPPRIKEARAALECERIAILEISADRAIAVGKVVAFYIQDDCMQDPAKMYIDTPKLNLVGRMHGRGWYTRTNDRFLMERIDLGEWTKKHGNPPAPG